MPQRLRDALQPLSFSLPLWVWGVGVLGILLIAVMEGAYREISQRDAVIEQSKPKPRAFGNLIQLIPSEQYHDINLGLVSTADTDWFTVSVLDVRPRVPGDRPPLPWDVKWADIDDKRRHIPKNSTANLRLCRIETQQDDKTRRAIRARFFTPSEELEVTLSLAEAWNAQDIFIGFRMVIPEIQIRVTAEGVNKTTDRRVSLTLNDQLEPHIYKVEVVPEG
ncbi:MAG TPA: hypothetical protein VEK37_03445 [Gemmatimonadaceae bacterium]|nr:hypothetical protein [Gemmatimonadaceae bacterium]